MRLTSEHAVFYMLKRSPGMRRHFGLRLANLPPLYDIDRLINSQAGPPQNLEASNTLNLVRMRLKRMPLMEALLLLQASDDKRRRQTASRWIRRVQEHQRKHREPQWYVVITNDQDDDELWRRDLNGDDLISCRHWADVYAQENDLELDIQEGKRVYTGCADFTVTIKHSDMGPAHVWDSESFFLRSC